MADQKQSQLLGANLAFTAGFIDTVGFIALFGLFTAHVTGNFVLIGATLADFSQAAILLKFLAFPAFIAGIVALRLLVRQPSLAPAAALCRAYALEALLLLAFMLCGVAATPVGDAPGALAMTAGLLGTAAMGAHSAGSRLLLPQLAPTSMMTGNVTQFAIDSVDIALGHADAETRARCTKFLWPLLGFFAGCIAGAFGYTRFGFWCILLPLCHIAALALTSRG
ncbi:YoaK family protein [Massilia endophytica]|uniref:YoaK family protein n=1 Tax=Massilia endophytica TaxID=2899220 RepID=UPI001E5BE54E|nr:YoaK family protein [Massilia endophytica]UGQ48710.1 DUF1275 domain-containing protein [Massilia endophytica]